MGREYGIHICMKWNYALINECRPLCRTNGGLSDFAGLLIVSAHLFGHVRPCTATNGQINEIGKFIAIARLLWSSDRLAIGLKWAPAAIALNLYKAYMMGWLQSNSHFWLNTQIFRIDWTKKRKSDMQYIHSAALNCDMHRKIDAQNIFRKIDTSAERLCWWWWWLLLLHASDRRVEFLSRPFHTLPT